MYHKLDSPLSPTNIPCLKDYPPNLINYGIMEFPNSIVNWEKCGSTA